MSRRRNAHKMKTYLINNSKCECCGENATQVHHKIPLVLGGEDNEKNYMSLCDTCHEKQHNVNRSELTKIGMLKAKENAKNRKPQKVLIDVLDLLYRIGCEDYLSTTDIVDMIIESKTEKIVYK